MNLSQIIIRPVLTEKSASQEVANKMTFVVHADATKVDVKNAIKTLYGVSVAKVNVLPTLPKYRIGKGRMPLEKRQRSRRAIVTLKAGEKLDITKSKTATSKSKAASK